MLTASLGPCAPEAIESTEPGEPARDGYAPLSAVIASRGVVTREDHLQAAREKKIQYEIQDEDPGTQTVRVSSDTAVVTARLWIKGTKDGVAFDRRLWFSDTYVRTPQGWKYFFGQASLPLPDATPDH